jgi:hypothetical protein
VEIANFATSPAAFATAVKPYSIIQMFVCFVPATSTLNYFSNTNFLSALLNLLFSTTSFLNRIVIVFSIHLHIAFNMASFNNPVAGGQNLPDSTQIETIWSMGFASLTSNKYHVVVPMFMAQAIGDEGVNTLKLRLA